VSVAAIIGARIPEILHLRHVRPGQLEAVLQEEIRIWHQQLSWDFRGSADLVRRFVDAQALNGFALMLGDQLIGYSYFVAEEYKGLIGDLYLLEEFRTIERENQLLGAVLDALMHSPHLHRIESQLMLLRSAYRRPAPPGSSLRVHERNFMIVDLSRVHELPAVPARPKIVIESWTESRQEEAAQLIADAYHGHVDSEINDQYRSTAGARRFLFNIVQYPGCGSFFQPASYIASELYTGRLCGISLCSLVANEVGHITQICVSPAVKGTGVGYQLLRQTLRGLAEHGCRKVSLTVTAENREAVALYERTGFFTARKFPAYVWEF
jgi:ribosomal protein S18 acetylase RimI-like enzyme